MSMFANVIIVVLLLGAIFLPAVIALKLTVWLVTWARHRRARGAMPPPMEDAPPPPVAYVRSHCAPRPPAEIIDLAKWRTEHGPGPDKARHAALDKVR